MLLAAGIAGVALRARAEAERALRESRLLASAESATDPSLAVLLLSELSDNPPARAFDVAQRVLGGPVPAAVLEGARNGVALAVSPDGALVAAGLRDGVVAVFRTDGTGTPLRLRHDGQRVDDLAFTPDGTRLVAAGHEGSLHVHWLDGREPRCRSRWAGRRWCGSPSRPTAPYAAAAALDGRLTQVALNPVRVLTTALHDAPVFVLAFMPRGDRLVTADAQGEVLLLDPASGAVLARRSTGQALYALAVAPGGSRLAVAGASGLIRLLGPGLEPLGAMGIPGSAVTTLAFESGQRPAGRGRGGRHPRAVRLPGRPGARVAARPPRRLQPGLGAGGRRPPDFRHRRPGAPLVREPTSRSPPRWRGRRSWPPPSPPTAAASSPAPREGTLRVWPIADAGARGLLAGHRGYIDTVTWSHDGRRLLTASHDGTARTWDRASGRQLLKMTDPAGVIHSAAWDPAETRILTSSEDGVARIWSATDGALLLALPPAGAPVLFAAWSPDGTRVATAGLDGVIRLHAADGHGEVVRLEGHEAGITDVAFSPDGRQVISASQLDASVRLWPLDGGAPRVLRADRAVFRGGLSPRGDRLAVAEVDGPLRLFNAVDLTELPPLRAWPERLWAPAWSPDQRRLALASFDGSVRVVPLDGRGDAAGAAQPPAGHLRVGLQPRRP